MSGIIKLKTRQKKLVGPWELKQFRAFLEKTTVDESSKLEFSYFIQKLFLQRFHI